MWPAQLNRGSIAHPEKMKSKTDILVHFGLRVRELRTQNGMSQEQLAFKAGVHRTYIGMIERAEKNVTLISIEKLANALGVSITTLFE
ncbi:DNA-binding transcriptional regulator, XRE-family HTH domain [Neolewinella agarilytica]|uniref:DNA-binding transcriptional regulator, XRE-family HTH domain n=2 Tax=Neolewinella agarilytica TaxID=478744 RepID=A0A1H9M086_9BACT|nr:DNA-binding transcriptional regulator, XRE-family HTH domain [Neolewinella agarilytica]